MDCVCVTFRADQSQYRSKNTFSWTVCVLLLGLIRANTGPRTPSHGLCVSPYEMATFVYRCGSTVRGMDCVRPLYFLWLTKVVYRRGSHNVWTLYFLWLAKVVYRCDSNIVWTVLATFGAEQNLGTHALRT
jgi:hypothetical protein